MDFLSILLIVAVILLMFVLRGFAVMEQFKKRAAIAHMERQKHLPRNTEEKARILRAILRNRLDLDFAQIPLESTWKGSLRIPAGELYEFFQDVDQEFMLDDLSGLERQATYGELLGFIGITPNAMLSTRCGDD
jgi:hypothetical protein